MKAFKNYDIETITEEQYKTIVELKEHEELFKVFDFKKDDKDSTYWI